MSLHQSLTTRTEKEKPSLNADHTSLLVSFCNQVSSPDCSLCIFDMSSRASRWIDFSSLSDDVCNSFSCVCGICGVAEDVIITTQGASPILATVSIAEAKITNYVALKKCKDTHSLVYSNGYVYIVSTGTNEIYRVPFKDGQLGEEELFWNYPGVSHERDEVHLNGLTVDGDDLIASCFGPKNAEGAWGLEGRVFHVESGASIHAGLNQPHTPLVIGDQLVFVESAESKVFMYTKTASGAWTLSAEIKMPGYTRGLALQDGHLLVGISSSRNVSRSRKTAVADIREPTDTAIMRVDLETHSTEVACDLSAFAREVYDIVSVNGAPSLSSPFDVLSHRVREMESTIDRYIVNVQSLLSQLNEAHQTASCLQNELEMTRQTVSWRVTAPLRSGRKALDFLIARFRNPPHTSNSGRSAPVTTALRDSTESGCSDDRSA